MRVLLIFILFFIINGISAQGSFAPAVGISGSTAIYKDSVIIKSWASKCTIKRGFIDIKNKNLGRVNFGKTEYAIGKSDSKVISLGDSGVATVSYNGRVYNGSGADFCIFENSFNNGFLELAFVEVSSNGTNFFRFPAFSETDTSIQIGSFDLLDASEIHNLAGKYKGQYGTPFDLEDLKNTVGLNIDSVTHIRVIDVVGSIDTLIANRDSKGRIINDPYPTDFKNGEFYTGGFDLEAVGLINYKGEIFLSNRNYSVDNSKYLLYPNPVNSILHISRISESANVRVLTISGTEVPISSFNKNEINVIDLKRGIYFIEIEFEGELSRQKFVKL